MGKAVEGCMEGEVGKGGDCAFSWGTAQRHTRPAGPAGSEEGQCLQASGTPGPTTPPGCFSLRQLTEHC